MYAIYNLVKSSNRTTHRCQTLRRGQSSLSRQSAESDDDSDETSPDEAQPLSKITTPVRQRKATPDVISGCNTKPEVSDSKTRKISTIINDMRKTSTVKEMADFIIYPDSSLCYYWMTLVALSVMYNCAVIILRLAFTELRDEHSFYLLDNITDAIYLVDILVQSRTAFLEDGCLVLNPSAMLQNYRKRFRFWLDMVAIFPAATTYWTFGVFLNAITFNFASLFSVPPIPALRFLRILKYHEVATFFEIADSRTRRPSLLRASKLSLHLWLVIHWIACIYYMMSEFEGLGTNDWVYTSDVGGGFKRKYIRSVFWSMMTLTTIGERPSPETDLEYIFTGMTFLIGVFVFAAVVGNVGDVISNMNAARHDFQSRMDQIKFYMNHRSVPEDLQDRVKKWAEYSWNRTQAMDEPSVLAMLPDRIRTEIAIHVHLETLKQVKIFEECEEGLLRELVLKLRPQIYSPGDYICRTGEIGREMYIINHGKIEILVQKGASKTRVAMLKPGNYFGEISLLKLDEGQNRRTADVKSIGYAELLCLSRKDLISALVEYPDAKKILEAQAMKRMQETKGVRQTNGSANTVAPVPPKQHEPTKKKASDVFSHVMKQEGFRKLLSNRDTEMAELKRLVTDMKTVYCHKTQNDPDRDALEEKCRAMEQKILNKDTALKQARRRINQLETYVRIRAYNAKFQREHVPESDPKQLTIPNSENSNGENNHTNRIPNIMRQRKLAGNLALMRGRTIRQDSDSTDTVQTNKSLERCSSFPERQPRYHVYCREKSDHDASRQRSSSVPHRKNNDQHCYKTYSEDKCQYDDHGHQRSSPVLQNGSGNHDNSEKLHNDSRDIASSLPEVQKEVFSVHVDCSDVCSNNSSKTPHSSRNTILKSCDGDVLTMNGNSITNGHHDNGVLNTVTYSSCPGGNSVLPQLKRSEAFFRVVNDKVIPVGTHITTATIMLNTKHNINSNEETVSKMTTAQNVGEANSHAQSQVSENDAKINGESYPNSSDTSFHINSEEAADSGISDNVHEDEELFRLVEFLSKDDSLDSNNTSLSHSDSNSEFSSNDDDD